MEQQQTEEETRRAVCAVTKEFNRSQVNLCWWSLLLLFVSLRVGERKRKRESQMTSVQIQ